MEKEKIIEIAKIIGLDLSKRKENEGNILDVYAYKFKQLKLNASARKEMGKELSVEEKEAMNWETVGDVLSFFDASSLAKENPKESAGLLKTIVSIVGAINPKFKPIAKGINAVPDKQCALIIEWLGKPTPEHIVHEIAKKQSKKKRKNNAIVAIS